MRSEVHYGDIAAGGPRAETQVSGRGAPSRYRSGDAAFYGFSLGLPAGWLDDGAAQDIVFQWKNIGANKSPDAFLSVKRDMFVLRITSDANRVSTSSSPHRELEMLVRRIDFAAGGWHDFAFEIHWSYGSGGRIEARHRHGGPLQRPTSGGQWRTVLEHAGPNMHNDQHAGYLKWGIYKPA